MSTQNPPTFHKFSNLPPSLREKIFLLANPPLRTRFLEIYNFTNPSCLPRMRYIPALPPLFHTTQESRRVITAHQGGSRLTFKTSNGISERKMRVYFNFNQDIIFLSSRFDPLGTATETYKLRILSTMLTTSSLARLQRICITYSNLDPYFFIGPVFRNFSSLDTFYLAMLDQWSRISVKKRVLKGFVKTGVEVSKLRSEVEMVEADETEDDEESDQDREAREVFRKARRFVEVELRLDD